MEYYFDRLILNIKAKQIEDNLEIANKKMENVDFVFTLKEEGIVLAKDFLEKTLPNLNFIKTNGGAKNPIYKDMCDIVAIYADTYMRPQLQFNSLFTLTNDYHKDEKLLHKIVSDNAIATKMMSEIITLDITLETKRLLKETLKIINAIERRINKKTGCYIATVVFDDYNNENVLILRSYRDNILAKKQIGKLLIDIYYSISPKLIKHIGSSNIAKIVFRHILIVVVKKLNK
jgi:hypothetical protein